MKKYYYTITLTAVVNLSLAQKHHDTIKTENIESVIITGKKNHHFDRISRNTLDVIQSSTLGETLSKIPGIQNTFYGPNAGTPMIRSLTGNRVKVLKNGIGMNDLSGISPDYNIDFNPDDITSMEVHKNSAAVLYGGKAIGGAVNINSNSIPLQPSKNSLSATLILEGSSNNGFKQGIQLKGNIHNKWNWQASAHSSERNFIKIPGNTKSDFCYNKDVVGFDPIMKALCQVQVDSEHVLNITIFPYLNQFVLDNLNNPDWGLSENDQYTFESKYYDPKTRQYKDNPKNPKYVAGQDPVKDRYTPVVRNIKDTVPLKKGQIPNSHSEKRSAGVGFSYTDKNFYTGFGYEGDYSYYGIPGYAIYGKAAHSHVKEKQQKSEYLPINIDSRTHRITSETGIKLQAPIQNLKIKYAAQLSENTELLENHHANLFKIQQHSARLEARQKTWNFLSGTSGIDIDFRKITGTGRLRYMPNTSSIETGMFTLQNLDFNFIQAHLGYRYDTVKREVNPDGQYKKGRGLAGGQLSTRNFDLNQFTGKLKFNLTKNFFLSGNFSHSERAPEVNELYTGNDHYAILAEENGNDLLKKEQANTIEIKTGADFKNLKISTSIYQTQFKDYIYLAHTGISRDGFVVKEWRAGDTKIEGIESEASYRILPTPQSAIEFSGFYDLVKNKNNSDDEMRKHSDGDYMPNMPTSRYGFGLSGALGNFSANILFERYLKQKFLGKNINPELAMPAYNLLSARLAYQALLAGKSIEYYAFGTNLLNAEARPQNSVLKYISPLPGINIGVGLKVEL